MLAAYFRCGGLVGDALLDRLGSQLGDDADAWEPLALAQVVAPSAVAAGATAAMLSVASRQRVIGRALARAAAARPVIALLDDAHASAATIAFVTAELTARVQRPARVLYVLTVQDEALAERPWERERLDALLALPGASRLGVGPLGGETWRALVRNLLGLEGRVAALVEEHAHGNPTFAVQLVGDWVQRGVLAAGPTGFRLRPGVRPELPDGLHGVWARRFDQALAGRPEADRIALEVGAALGRVVRIEEWLLACAEAGAPPTPGAVEALVARNLARAEGDTWSFAQAMVSASIERLARAAGRWEAHHRACAAALASAHPHEAPGLARRIAGHLGMAQDWLGSLRPLLVAAREALLTDAYPDAHTLLDRRESALVAAGVGFDTRWAEGWALRAEVFRQEGRYDEARVSARRAEDAARRAGDDAVLADALSSLGQAERQQGDFPAAEGHLLAALALYRRVGRDAGEVECLHGLGVIAQRTAQTDRAWSFGEEVRTLSARTGNAHGLARALSQLGDIARERGDADLAFAFQEQALVAYTRIGSRWGAGFVENSVGNLYVRRGHTEAAEAAYRRSLALFEAIDSPQTVIPLTNLGAMQLARGEVAGARATLESALPRLEALGWRAYIANTHVQLLVCAALQGDWAAWRRSLPVADALLTELQISDEDVAQDAARAGTVAAAAGELAGAHAAWAIARTQWERLGRADRVGEVDAWLRGAAAGGGTGV
jgi:tetratricopeptide (TPR) repeat protein